MSNKQEGTEIQAGSAPSVVTQQRPAAKHSRDGVYAFLAPLNCSSLLLISSWRFGAHQDTKICCRARVLALAVAYPARCLRVRDISTSYSACAPRGGCRSFAAQHGKRGAGTFVQDGVID